MNRRTFRLGHQGLELAHCLGESVLFPGEEIETKPSQVLRKSRFGRPKSDQEANDTSGSFLTFMNTTLNERQRAAVERIVKGQSRPTPYVLFGPPGTGKTVTLVEAVLQLYENIRSTRILCCAPSNSAADLIAERLLASGRIGPADLVRFNASQRNVDVPAGLTSYCVADDIEEVVRRRLIVTTCTTSGSFFGMRLSKGHITHIFIDEAGQATEAETLIPFSLASVEHTQIVLAGDPHQLGPVLSSYVARHHGFDVSLLQRLLERPLYHRDADRWAQYGAYDPRVCTKLIDNYRSHADLLHVSSRLFYHSELRACADPAAVDRICGWRALRNPKCPILFHGICGEDMREADSPSWFNPQEAHLVLRYLSQLMADSSLGLDYGDVGIITPYRKQVEKIRHLIDKMGHQRVKVGSVEEFQGQERPVIIISTVRAREQEAQRDLLGTIGFLSNPKRFNVAITRAQALLVIIGNSKLLSQDPCWRSLLVYCLEKQAYTGVEFSTAGSTIDARSDSDDD